MNFWAFFVYLLSSAFTPGPNNIISMMNAGRYGFKGALPYSLGVFLGLLVLGGCSAALSSLLYGLSPAARSVMLALGAAYLLWLAWSLLRNSPGEGRSFSRADTVASGVFMQFINLHAYFYCLAALSSFVLPYHQGLLPVAGSVVLLAALAFVACCCWAAFGVVVDRFFKDYGRLFNAAMASLLVYCAAMMLRDVVF